MIPIIIDLEWNQPLKGRTHVADLPGEIIQIGAAKTDLKGNVLDTISITVKPVYYKRINKEISALTMITDGDLEKGMLFPQAIEKFKAWCGEDFVFVEWGPEDFYMLSDNLRKHGLDDGWLPRSYDGQLMFDDMEMQEDRQWPLNYALYHYSEKPDGAHNALADVLSTAAVLRHLDLEEGLSDDYFRCDDLE